MLVIDEHCSVDGRHIFDQDNKGWRSVSNAIKGRPVPDDDQFTLALALISEKSEMNVCHITLLGLSDTDRLLRHPPRGLRCPELL